MRLRSYAVAVGLGCVLGLTSAWAADRPIRSASRASQVGDAGVTASHVELLILEGSQGSGGRAPGLPPQLSDARFQQYTQIRVASRTTIALQAEPVEVAFEGGLVRVSLGSRLPNGRYRVNVHLTLGQRGHDLTFDGAQGDPFFTVHVEPSATSALILGFTIRR